MSDLYKIKKAPPGSPKKWQIQVRSKSGGVKTVSFGARGYEDYTQHKDKDRRENYRSRHRNDNIKDPTSAGFWSWHVLWGDSTSISKNLSATKRKFKLGESSMASRKNPQIQMKDLSKKDLKDIREEHKQRAHFTPRGNPDDYSHWGPENYEALALDRYQQEDELDLPPPYEWDDSDYSVDVVEVRRRTYQGRVFFKGKLVEKTGFYPNAAYADVAAAWIVYGMSKPRANPNRAERFPRSTVVQSLIFDKGVFTKASARRWAKEHGFSSTGLDEKENTYRLRQHDPHDFSRGTFRTIEMTDGVMGVVAMPLRGVDL